MKFLRCLVLTLALTGGAIGLINLAWKQLIIRPQLNHEISRSYQAPDVSTSIRILKKALAQYPQAPNRAAAETLLRIYQHSEALAQVIEQAQAAPDPSTAIALLNKGLTAYSQATNCVAARKILTDYRQQQDHTKHIAAAIQSAMPSKDLIDAIYLLEVVLQQSPKASNRKEAEDLLDRLKQQQSAEESAEENLQQALTDIQQASDAAGAMRRLEEALAQCPKSPYRQEAQDLLDQYKKQNEPLAVAIAGAKAADDRSAAIAILEKALAQYPASPAREEAQQLRDEYQKQVSQGTENQQKDLSQFLQKISQGMAAHQEDFSTFLQQVKKKLSSDHYAFYSPGTAPARDTQPVPLQDSTLVNRPPVFNYSLEMRLATDTILKDKTNAKPAGQAEGVTFRYRPRLTITARNHALKAESTLVIEYFISKDKEKTNIIRASTEVIPMPEIPISMTLTVDADGIKLAVPSVARNGTSQDDESLNFYGAIVSLFDPEGVLLTQKYSASKLSRECSSHPSFPGPYYRK